MLPTIRVGGDLVVEANWRAPVRRGDIVTYVSPLDPAVLACKRVVGVAGDTVAVDPSGVSGGDAAVCTVAVPDGHVWVQGDNYANSTDSRRFGPLPLALVRGRIIARVRGLSGRVRKTDPGLAVACPRLARPSARTGRDRSGVNGYRSYYRSSRRRRFGIVGAGTPRRFFDGWPSARRISAMSASTSSVFVPARPAYDLNAFTIVPGMTVRWS